MDNQQIRNIEEDYIVCPLCGKKYKALRSNHLSKVHKITLDEFREMYPDFILESKSARINRSLAGRRAWANPEKRRNILKGLRSVEASKKMSEAGLRNWNNPVLRESRVKTMREVANTPESKEKFSRNSKKTWENPEFRERRVEGIRKATSTEEYKEGQRIRSIEMWKNPDHPQKVIEGYRNSNRKFPFTYKDGRVIQTRSSYEVKVCGYLESLGIDFDYEKHRFDYYLDKEYPGYAKGFHSYYPDFYLPSLDIFLEVKPEGLDRFVINQVKVESVRKSGKVIEFVLEKDIETIETFKNLIERISTTILKQP